MSRTFKDKPYWVNQPSKWSLILEDADKLSDKSFLFIYRKKRKKQTFMNDYWYYCKAPGWWNHMTTTTPRRRQGRFYELLAKNTRLEDLEDLDIPTNWKKPREHYW